MPEGHCDHSPAHLHWTTHNLGEVMPGLQTPLSFSVWQRAMDWASHRTCLEVGAMRADEGERGGRFRFPEPLEAPLLRSFYGRVAFQVEYFAAFGDRMPAISGAEVCRSILGRVPDGLEFRPTRARYPAVAWRFPRVLATIPGRVRRAADEGDAWYHAHLERLPALDRPAATRALLEATDRLERAVSLQAITLLGCIQPLWQRLEAIVAEAGIGDTGVLSGTGGAEANLVRDIWRASRGEVTLEAVRRRHGFHGPVEGELSARTWREDPAPLSDLVARYTAEPEAADPVALEQRSDRERERLVREILAATAPARRPATRLALTLAARGIPLRGVAKETFLQAFDGARAAARHIGDLLAAEGVLSDREDVFFLTKAELTGSLPPDPRILVAERRALRAEHARYRIPPEWTGMPRAQLTDQGEDEDEARPPVVTGVGVSTGVVEGVARVVMEPDFTDVEAGEVLIAPFTDPGWASIMFVSSALVVDIGGALSHAAVVARELGIPCVVNTTDGTRSIRTGDRVRVDGGTGRVEVLQRAATQTA